MAEIMYWLVDNIGLGLTIIGISLLSGSAAAFFVWMWDL